MQGKKDKSSSSGQSERVFLTEVLVDLANMDDDRITRFREKWGHLYRNRRLYNDQNLLKRRDELRLIWNHRIRFELAKLPINMDGTIGTPLMWEDGTEFPRVSNYAGRLDETFIEHLHAAPQKFQLGLEEFICDHWLHLEKGRGWIVRWRPDEKGVKARRSSLPTVLIYGCLRYADHLTFCRNQECPAPYFLARKSDQKYCSNICASPAKRAAKLRWWHENKGEKPQGKKSRK